MDVLSCTKLLFGTLEDEHVGVRHTEGKHDTGDTRKGKHCLERCEDTHGEEEVAHKTHVGDKTRDETVDSHHEDHEEHESDDK